MSRTRWAREDLLSETRWQLSLGESLWTAAENLGVTLSGIERAARRADDVEMARIVNNARATDRRWRKK
jgi:hypothetical protein